MIKYVIVLILVILIIILLRNLQREEFVNNSNFWNGYRLADIYACWTHPKYDKYTHEYYNSIPEIYPNSIGSEYVLRNKPMKKPNFLLLNKIIEEKSHKRVVIMYGNHLNDINIKPTEIYLNKIRDLFKKNNINFIENNSGNPDKDFLYMTNSKTFIKSGGGYSNLIASIVHYRNNNVFQVD